MLNHSFVIQNDAAQALLSESNHLVVDLSAPDNYRRVHLPGAINLDYAQLVHGAPPAPGALPAPARLQVLLQTLGIGPDTHLLVYDDEGNGRACRFLWVLDCVGHQHYKLLDGGIHAWAGEGRTLESTVNAPVSAGQAPPEIKIDTRPIATKESVLAAIDQTDTVILDVRTPQEYAGQRGGSRFGHIPSSVNLNWLDTMDQSNHLRLLEADRLMAMYAQIGVTPDKKIITHCQTHHRSAHTYAVLKHLGFAEVKGYAGSWAEWSSDPSLPIV